MEQHCPPTSLQNHVRVPDLSRSFFFFFEMQRISNVYAWVASLFKSILCFFRTDLLKCYENAMGRLWKSRHFRYLRQISARSALPQARARAPQPRTSRELWENLVHLRCSPSAKPYNNLGNLIIIGSHWSKSVRKSQMCRDILIIHLLVTYHWLIVDLLLN